MEFDKEVIDKLLANYQKPEDIVGENGLLKQLTKALVERAMEAELTTHLGYEKHDFGKMVWALRRFWWSGLGILSG